MTKQVRSATYLESCPECKANNYYDVGDPEDITGTDVEALECWKCGFKWLTEGSEEFTTLEDAFLARGRRRI